VPNEGRSAPLKRLLGVAAGNERVARVLSPVWRHRPGAARAASGDPADGTRCCVTTATSRTSSWSTRPTGSRCWSVPAAARSAAASRGGTWVHATTPTSPSTRSRRRSGSTSTPKTSWGVEPEQVDENNVRMHCRFSGIVRGTLCSAEVTVPVKISRGTCDRCGRIAGGYYARIVQVRADERDLTPAERRGTRHRRDVRRRPGGRRRPRGVHHGGQRDRRRAGHQALLEPARAERRDADHGGARRELRVVPDARHRGRRRQRGVPGDLCGPAPALRRGRGHRPRGRRRPRARHERLRPASGRPPRHGCAEYTSEFEDAAAPTRPGSGAGTTPRRRPW